MRLQLSDFEWTCAYAGYIMRDADLDAVAHYFEYTADDYAAFYLASHPRQASRASLRRASSTTGHGR